MKVICSTDSETKFIVINIFISCLCFLTLDSDLKLLPCLCFSKYNKWMAINSFYSNCDRCMCHDPPDVNIEEGVKCRRMFDEMCKAMKDDTMQCMQCQCPVSEGVSVCSAGAMCSDCAM